MERVAAFQREIPLSHRLPAVHRSGSVAIRKFLGTSTTIRKPLRALYRYTSDTLSFLKAPLLSLVNLQSLLVLQLVS